VNVLRLFSGAALAAAFGVFATSASATTVVVPDPSSPFIYFGKGDASVTYGGVTFSTNPALGDDYLFNVGSKFSGDPAVVSSQQAIAGHLANLLITLPYAVTSATVDFGTVNGSNVSVVLSNGVNFVVSTPSAALYLTSAFNMGGATPFDTIELTSTDVGVNVESITFNGAVPEPATWLMLIMGVAMIGFAARRQSAGMAVAV
jgi:hypothetical protein